MPTPDMTRVVQMEPGPTPTLMACTPALMRSAAPSAVTALPATMGRSVSLRRLETTSITRVVCPVAASMNRASAPAEIRATGSVQIIGADTHGGAAAQVAVFILGSVCKHGALLNVRFRDKAGQHAVFIHQRKLFNAVGVKDVARFLNGRGGSCRNQAGRGVITSLTRTFW